MVIALLVAVFGEKAYNACIQACIALYPLLDWWSTLSLQDEAKHSMHASKEE